MSQPVKYQGVDKQSSGYKLLAAMGWQEGSGLGARQQGIKEHVKVKKKHDATGVGAVEAIAKARDWTAGMAAYDLVLAKMKSVGAGVASTTKPSRKKRKRPEQETPSSLDTVRETPSTTIPPVTEHSLPSTKQQKKQKKAQLKPAAVASSDMKSQPSSHSATQKPKAVKNSTAVLQSPAAQSATAASAAAAAVAGAQVQRARGRHVGRYHKTAAAKQAGSYSKSDLAAILGLDSLPVAAPIVAKPVPSSAEDTSSSEDDQESSEDTTFEPTAAPVVSSGQTCTHQEAEVAPETEAQDGSQWWHGMFTRAGKMGTMASDIRSDSTEHGKQVKINGFSEQDQENLYNATQAGKSAGKKGLGKSSQGKPIGGAKWEGTKKAFDGEEEDEPSTVVPTEAAPAPSSITDSDSATTDTLLTNIKWKKKAKRALSAAGGKMKLNKLLKQLLQECKVPEAHHAVVSTKLNTQLTSSKQFKVSGSSIALE